MLILRLRRKDKVGECDGEYRHAEEESVGDPLPLLFGLALIRRSRHPSANDCSAHLVCFHVACSSPYCSAARLSDLPCGQEQPVGLPIARAETPRGVS